MLAEGLSLEAIGRRVGRHPSTVGYWIGKHGLKAVHREKHAARGGVDSQLLADLVAEGLSIRQISARINVSDATVKHWLKRWGLETEPARYRRITRESRQAGATELTRECKKHGVTGFVRPEGGRYFKCRSCRTEAVMRRRHKVRALLVAEAGGCCVLCGYARSIAALQFHHLDRDTKLFGLSNRGMTPALAVLRAEASKCVLLCSNCHVEVERGMATVPT